MRSAIAPCHRMSSRRLVVADHVVDPLHSGITTEWIAPRRLPTRPAHPFERGALAATARLPQCSFPRAPRVSTALCPWVAAVPSDSSGEHLTSAWVPALPASHTEGVAWRRIEVRQGWGEVAASPYKRGRCLALDTRHPFRMRCLSPAF